MRTGEFRHRIALQSATQTDDGMGGFTEAWATEETVWAAIWPLKGSTLIDSLKLETTITHRIVIRYKSGIQPYWRVLYGTRVFTIDSIINPDERNRYLELMCWEVL